MSASPNDPILLCYDRSDGAPAAPSRRPASCFPGRTAVVLHVWSPLIASPWPPTAQVRAGGRVRRERAPAGALAVAKKARWPPGRRARTSAGRPRGTGGAARSPAGPRMGDSGSRRSRRRSAGPHRARARPIRSCSALAVLSRPGESRPRSARSRTARSRSTRTYRLLLAPPAGPRPRARRERAARVRRRVRLAAARKRPRAPRGALVSTVEWRRRESNPRPRTRQEGLLQAQPAFMSRRGTPRRPVPRWPVRR